MSAQAATLPPAPAHLAQLQVSAEGRPAVSVTLHEVKRWKDKALVQDSTLWRDPLSTAFTPAVQSGDATLVWLVGYGLSAHENPGDTLVTRSLVIQLPRTPQELATAIWFEDHQEVPTNLFIGGGRVTSGQGKAASTLDLKVKDVDYGDVLSITGLLRSAP